MKTNDGTKTGLIRAVLLVKMYGGCKRRKDMSERLAKGKWYDDVIWKAIIRRGHRGRWYA